MLQKSFQVLKMNKSEFAKFYLESYIPSVYNSSISMEMTFRCPLQCPFCDRQDPKYKKTIERSKDLPVENFIRVCESNHKKITFCGDISDPIYHPDFLEILKVMTLYKDKIFVIHTTATRKSLTWWNEVFDMTTSNIHWIFGLDGTDQETANIYRVNTRYDEVIEVMKLAVSKGINCIWSFIVFKHNEHQIEDFKKISEDIGISIRIVKSNRWPKNLVKKYKIYPPSEKWIPIKDKTKHEYIYRIKKK